MKMKNCQHCNEEFEPVKTTQKFCSELCKSRHRNKNRTKKKEEERAKRKCESCGGSMAHKRLSSKFCSDRCRAAASRKNQEEHGRKCGFCKTSIDGKHMGARFCSDKCRTLWHNGRRHGDKEERECHCCGKVFKSFTAKWCSKKCRNMREGDWKSCEICNTKFLTGKGSRKTTCSEYCAETKRFKTRNKKEYRRRMGILEPVMPVKAKKKKKNTKARVNKKKTSKVERIANINEALKNHKPRVEVPMFKSQPEPKQVAGNNLKTKIAERSKKRGFTPEDEMKAMQDKWLKSNKPKTYEPEPEVFKPYEGELEPLYTYSRTGKYNPYAGELVEGGLRDYG